MVRGMLKYQAVAVVLKALSLNAATRRSYRRLGNWRMNRAQSFDTEGYLLQSRRLVEQIRAHCSGGKLRIAELGAGWTHFYGIAAALSTGASVDFYDVWDNRQFRRLGLAFRDPSRIAEGLNLSTPEAKEQAIAVSTAGSFEDVYQALGARYVLDPGGVLAPLPSETYDAVFSMDVLEHVGADALADAIAGQFRILRPGGVAIHEIGVDDHLRHYDPRASKKQYLAYGDAEWRRRFENKVQYFNRVSFDRFRELFLAAGFEEVTARCDRGPEQLSGLRIDPSFHGQSQESLEAVRVFLVYRKPDSQAGAAGSKGGQQA
jgi:SAM-dependent methyltransferase